jgi:hypothetical protein
MVQFHFRKLNRIEATNPRVLERISNKVHKRNGVVSTVLLNKLGVQKYWNAKPEKNQKAVVESVQYAQSTIKIIDLSSSPKPNTRTINSFP